MPDRDLTDDDRRRYAWQITTPEFGEAGQQKLKNASVLVSRVGGVGSVAAYELAAAGIGKLVLAHAGNVRENDLNRQLLMTTDGIGQSRVESAARRLAELNPHCEIVPVAENIGDENAARLVGMVDLVIDCAPLFAERLAVNAAAVRQKKPLVDCAMYDFEVQLTSIVPGQSPCLACLYPQAPPLWKREFPVFGEVAGTIGALAAVEAIKLLTGLGQPLVGQMLHGDLREMTFRRVKLKRNPQCPVCKAV